jgi:hypothetical protein
MDQPSLRGDVRVQPTLRDEKPERQVCGEKHPVDDVRCEARHGHGRVHFAVDGGLRIWERE